jgi:ABC-2 type transport system permease protein
MIATSTPLTIGRDLAAPMPILRILRAYAAEMRFETVRMLRSPGFAIPFLLLPVPIYLFFGVVLPGPAIASKPGLANYLFSGWMAYAVMGPALFGVGCTLAVERDAGFLKLKRALPAPGGAHIVAKMAVAMAAAALAIVPLAITTRFAGGVTLSAAQILAMATVLVVGTLPFSAIGLFVGAHVSGSTAPAIINLVFLPMLWLSGMFFPLPKFLESWVVVWPAFHLNQISIAAGGIAEYRFMSPVVCAAVLTGLTVLFGGLAIRRLARKG